jgi:ribosome-associated protein
MNSHLTPFLDLLEDKKAEDIRCIDVHEHTTVTNHMIVATCQSKPQIKALASYITELAKKQGITILGVEGDENNEWVLVDLGNIILHLMLPDIRQYYDLEKLWS